MMVKTENQRLTRPPVGTWCLRLTLLWGAVTILAPLLVVLAVSGATRETYGWIRWVPTWANYAEVLHPLYGRIFLQSLLMACAATAGCLVLGFPLAYAIARATPRWQSIGLVMVLIPLWTNFLVRTYAWIVLLRSEGVLNSLLLWAGVLTDPIQVLYTPTAVLVGLIYGYLPFMVIPIYAALERISPLIEDAAQDLYAPFWTMVGRVVIPLAMPGILAGCALVFLASMGAYLTPDLLGGAKTMMIGNLIQHEFLVMRDWPLGSALSMVLMTVALTCVWAARRFTRYDGW